MEEREKYLMCSGGNLYVEKGLGGKGKIPVHFSSRKLYSLVLEILEFGTYGKKAVYFESGTHRNAIRLNFCCRNALSC